MKRCHKFNFKTRLGLDTSLFFNGSKFVINKFNVAVYHGLLKAWSVFKRRNTVCSFSTMARGGTVIGGARLDVEDESTPGLGLNLRTAVVLTQRHVVEVAVTDLQHSKAIAGGLRVSSTRYTKTVLRR